MPASFLDAESGDDAPRRSGGWYTPALQDLTDLVIVIDRAGTIEYTNPFADQILGHAAGEVVGSNIVDHIADHDLERALEVITMMIDQTLDVPVTPAVYGVKRSDGSLLPIELNASDLASTDPGKILVLGRYSGDRDLQDQMLELLTTGASPDDAIALIPGFGLWRHPTEHYAVQYLAPDGERRAAGTDLSVELAEYAGPTTPWELAVAAESDLIVRRDEVSPTLGAHMARLGIAACWVSLVPDPLTGKPAAAVAWCQEVNPDIRFHRFPLATMQRSLDLALQWRRQVTTLTDAARRDPLTGLANRTGLFDVIDSTAASIERLHVTLLYLDLDGFKAVNDAYGHQCGDAVLATAGRRIVDVVRPGDTVARLGGDEFAILCTDLADDASAAAVADRIIEAVSRPFRIDDIECVVGASIGIASAPSDTFDAHGLLHAADTALYRAKAAGRGRWVIQHR